MDVSLRLVDPIAARLGEHDAVILDLSMNRALVEHAFQLAGDETRLTFDWEGQHVEVECSACESAFQEELSDREQTMIYHTVFELSGERAALENALMSYALRVGQAFDANAEGLPRTMDESVDEMGRALRERRIGYVSYVLRDGTWHRFETMSPQQPLSGFTVAAHEDDDQLRLLRLAYEEADAEGRKLLRQFAAESIRKK